jgi:cell shape-determining protein MreD
MKAAVWLALGGLLAVLMESSLISAPVVLLYLWFWLDTKEMEKMLWTALVLGVLVDALSLRTLGVSSLLMIGFVFGDWLLRKLFAGMVLLEWAFLLCGMLVWQILFMGRISLVILVFWGGACLLMEVRKRFGVHQEIKLR